MRRRKVLSCNVFRAQSLKAQASHLQVEAAGGHCLTLLQARLRIAVRLLAQQERLIFLAAALTQQLRRRHEHIARRAGVVHVAHRLDTGSQWTAALTHEMRCPVRSAGLPLLSRCCCLRSEALVVEGIQ